MREIISIKLSPPFFTGQGILHESSCVYAPQQNGVTERKLGHIVSTTRARIFHQSVPKYLWGEALSIDVHLINRLPSKVLAYKSPIDLMMESFLDVVLRIGLKPRVFGCVVFVHLPYSADKLSPRSLRCIFVGYPTTKKGYRCYHPPIIKFLVSLDVTFQEREPYFAASPSPDDWVLD